MKDLFSRSGLCALTLAAAAVLLTSFRTDNIHAGRKRLHRIITPTDRTTISYHADKRIAKLVSVHQSGGSDYIATRIPVYENGKLVKTLFADNEAGTAPMLFSSFEYNSKDLVEKINYYRDEQVHAYDSLVYDNGGHITARYFFNLPEGKQAFENHHCQLYTWDMKGNIIGMESLGRRSNELPFTLSSSSSYWYDDRQNAQQSVPELVYITDVSPVNMSANNILSEVITPADDNLARTNSYDYTYNDQQYPVYINAQYAGNKETVPTKLEWTE